MKLVFSLITLLLISGCNNTPSADDIKAELKKQLESPWTVTSLALTSSTEPEEKALGGSLQSEIKKNTGQKYSFTARIAPNEPLYEQVFTLDGTQVLRKLRNEGEEKPLAGDVISTHDKGNSKLTFDFETSPYLREGKPSSAWPSPYVELDSPGFKRLVATAEQSLQPLEAQIQELENRIKQAKDKYFTRKNQMAAIETELFEKADKAFNSIKGEIVKFNIKIDDLVKKYSTKLDVEYNERSAQIRIEYEKKLAASGQDEADLSTMKHEMTATLLLLKSDRKEKIANYKHKLLEQHQPEKDKIMQPYTSLKNQQDKKRLEFNKTIKQLNAEIAALKKELKTLIESRKEIKLALIYSKSEG